MKNILCSALFFSVFSATFAQVGINTNTPNAILDITGKNISEPSNIDGLLIPRIENFPLENPTAAQNSMLVYLTKATASNSPFGTNQVGFYYWNFPQSTWVALQSTQSGWAIGGNNGTIDGTHFLGTLDNIPLTFRINNERSGRLDVSNTFYGYLSGNVNTGNSNVSVGDNSLSANTTGSQNTAVGSNALRSNTTSVANTAIGFESLFSNIAAGENVAVGYQALRNNTTDSNTAVGYQSLYGNTTGSSNTAVGRGALRSTVVGSSNTSIGRESLEYNTSGGNNSAVGTQALRNNLTGNDNAASGAFSLYNNTVGSGNSAFGINALNQNQSGESNTGIGKESMYNNRVGSSNVALGFASLYDNIDGNENVAIGPEASRDNSSGSRNVAIGHDASRTNTTGSSNVAVGNMALNTNATGSNNTAIGNTADVTEPNITNATALGNGAKVGSSNKVRIGNQDITSIEAQVGLSVASDRRFKDDIKPISLGLDFINQLQPVEYVKKNDTEMRKEWGLIAQDLKQILEDNHYSNAAVINSDNSEQDYLSIRYVDLIAPLIKSIQELSKSRQQTEFFQKKVLEQGQQINDLSSKLQELNKKLEGLVSESK
ncbi:tail fiber domain-containing protein [Chryseobacterium sp. KACC 21268]|nr:tail fiber domain-containing protein [Chryseobacterium sp. KACC 21268]